VTGAVEVIVALTVRDLTDEDLPACTWAGGGSVHLRYVAQELERVRRGAADYLAVCPPSDLPVAIGGVNYEVHPGAGTVWQLDVHPALRSCGIGTMLVGAAEARIAARGLRRAELSVEEGTPRARALYERLGYAGYGSSREGWDIEAPDGSLTRYEAVCTLMRKQLG